MKWEDTVRKVAPHSYSIVCPHCGEEFGIESIVENERKIQAEATWHARDAEIEQARQESRKEVVEFIKEHFSEFWNYHLDTWGNRIKEWGIK